MAYALIRNGLVENTIVADANFISGISSQWDSCVLIDNLDPKPGVGWKYNGSVFSDPVKLYAKINSNIVESMYWLHEDNELPTQQAVNQYVVEITNLDPMPTIGWTYNGSTFSAP